MATAKKLFLLEGGYDNRPSYWKRTRPNGFVPFHTENTNYQIGNSTTKQRNGNSWNWTEDLGSSDTYRYNASGIWYNGSYNSDKVYRHRVNHKVAHYSYILCGWPYDTAFQDIEKATSSPVTCFAGISFKWNTAGSYWSDSAIRINSNTAVSLVCYDWVSGNKYTQNSVNMYYSGRSPITDGSNLESSNNGCTFLLSDSDQQWIRNNKIYLIGFMIQFYQKSEGDSSRDRYFNIWDTQVVYSTYGAGQKNYTDYRMVMPDRQPNGIDYHGESPSGNDIRRPVKIYYSN